MDFGVCLKKCIFFCRIVQYVNKHNNMAISSCQRDGIHAHTLSIRQLIWRLIQTNSVVLSFRFSFGINNRNTYFTYLLLILCANLYKSL